MCCEQAFNPRSRPATLLSVVNGRYVQQDPNAGNSRVSILIGEVSRCRTTISGIQSRPSSTQMDAFD